ncbi:MAG TPA: AAA family ATPase [Longimicrobium sp.]|nr:AAA family ATPase [Longimicrobium sp.]
MEAVVFTGIQASGKSTFYRERFFHTHVRISLDLLKTRGREQTFLRACLATGQRFVVDNTNPTAADRAKYVAPAKAAGFQVVGYFFATAPGDAIRRNKGREGGAVIPVPGILGTYKRLEEPTHAEGFDTLYRVTIVEGGGFEVAEVERGGSA